MQITVLEILKHLGLENKFDQTSFNFEQMKNLQVSGLASNSKFAKSGDLFIAEQGAQNHGLDYAPAMIEKGINVFLYLAPYNKAINGKTLNPYAIDSVQNAVFIPVHTPENIAIFKFKLLELFYQQAISSLQIIGITGTEGKTSVSQFCAQALELLKTPCGIIGTNGIGRFNQLTENTHTTPDIASLYQSLNALAQQLANVEKPASIKPVALEVTSHALDQQRVKGLSFQVVALTNLARDHLDYHHTIEEYKQAKLKLFTHYTYKCAIINTDDAFGHEIIAQLPKEQAIIAYGQRPYHNNSSKNLQFLHIQNLNLTPQGLSFSLALNQKTIAISSPLYGHFNALNLANCAGILIGLRFSFDDVANVLPKLTTIQGRMQVIQTPKSPVVIVDYAHKPNALEQALLALKSHLKTGRLFCVFGCGGDRDQGKRPLMGAIAEKIADQVIITNDNPRTEDPEFIAGQILQGCSPNNSKIIKILDRKLAIETAIQRANPEDIILIAGKGHENYQIIGHEKTHFDDVQVVKQIMETPQCN